MPAGNQDLSGKVLQSGVREGHARISGTPYTVAFVHLLESKLREMVEVTKWLEAGAPNPFESYQRGQYVTLPVKSLRVYAGMLTGELYQAGESADEVAEPDEVES